MSRAKAKPFKHPSRIRKREFPLLREHLTAVRPKFGSKFKRGHSFLDKVRPSVTPPVTYNHSRRKNRAPKTGRNTGVSRFRKMQMDPSLLLVKALVLRCCLVFVLGSSNPTCEEEASLFIHLAELRNRARELFQPAPDGGVLGSVHSHSFL